MCQSDCAGRWCVSCTLLSKPEPWQQSQPKLPLRGGHWETQHNSHCTPPSPRQGPGEQLVFPASKTLLEVPFLPFGSPRYVSHGPQPHKDSGMWLIAPRGMATLVVKQSSSVFMEFFQHVVFTEEKPSQSVSSPSEGHRRLASALQTFALSLLFVHIHLCHLALCSALILEIKSNGLIK